MTADDDRERTHPLNRRNILLGGTTLAAASAFAGGAPINLAQAQAPQPAPATGQRPNILVIWGTTSASPTSAPTRSA